MSRRESLWDYCRRHDLLAPGRAVLVGVSGGPDSLCLLDKLHALAAEHDFPLAVAHFDHGLRPESAEEAAFVRAEAEKRGRPFFTSRADTTAFAAENGLSIETAARQLRYAFLARAARQSGALLVAVAHTADDQAETVLMNFLRGSGLNGLRGMRPRSPLGGMVPGEGVAVEGRAPDASPLTLIRPLLGTTRQEVEKYCAEHGLQPRHDPSNADLHYTRNRLRHVVLPVLEQENPNIRATLARTAEVLAGEHEAVERSLEGLWEWLTADAEQLPGQAHIDRYKWHGLLPGQRRAILRHAAARVLGDTRDLPFDPLDAADAFALRAETGRTCEIARGLRLAVAPRHIVLYVDQPPTAHYPLLLDGDGKLPDGWRFMAEATDSQDLSSEPWEAIVPTATLTAPLIVRPRRSGERFQPLGMGGHSMKVSDFLINEKVAAVARNHWPIVVCGETVVWVAGLRVDERFRLRPDTAERTRLRFVFQKPVATDPVNDSGQVWRFVRNGPST